jgi:hypothetical protein
MCGATYPLSHYAFMAWYSVKKKRSTGTNFTVRDQVPEPYKTIYKIIRS